MYLKGTGYRFFAVYYKGNNVFDFLFTFLHTKPLREAKQFDRVASPESVPVPNYTYTQQTQNSLQVIRLHEVQANQSHHYHIFTKDSFSHFMLRATGVFSQKG